MVSAGDSPFCGAIGKKGRVRSADARQVDAASNAAIRATEVTVCRGVGKRVHGDTRALMLPMVEKRSSRGAVPSWAGSNQWGATTALTGNVAITARNET